MATTDWTPTNLHKLWPVHKLPVTLDEAKYITQVNRSIDKTGGYGVEEIFQSSTAKHRIHIPKHYLNAFIILTAKIKYLQQGIRMRAPPGFDNATAERWGHAIDSMKRNLLFHVGVLEDFFSDIATSFYSSWYTSGTTPSTPLHEDFHSDTLNSWLYVEFFAAHHPPTYDEFQGLEGVEKHPLEIGLDGMY
jgi:hypothetical protein